MKEASPLLMLLTVVKKVSDLFFPAVFED